MLRKIQKWARNCIKGFAVSFSSLFSFFNHEVPKNNQMYIFYLLNANGLEHSEKGRELINGECNEAIFFMNK